MDLLEVAGSVEVYVRDLLAADIERARGDVVRAVRREHECRMLPHACRRGGGG